jgi:hypothetical protein
MNARVVASLVVVLFGASVAGCTSLLGDFSIGNVSVDGGVPAADGGDDSASGSGPSSGSDGAASGLDSGSASSSGGDAAARGSDSGDGASGSDAHAPVDAAEEPAPNPCPPAGCLCESNSNGCTALLPYACSDGTECCNWLAPGCP